MSMDIKDYIHYWEEVGKTDPLWGILSLSEKKGNKWDIEEFYATGTAEIDAMMASLTNIMEHDAKSVVLDFGCGVGRLSRRLSKYFRGVLAVDISSVMLDLARKNNSNYKNIEFIQNRENNLKIIDDESVDFIYSNITLQHIPRIFQEEYIAEFCRVLKKNGVLVFQTPSHIDFTLKGVAYLLLGNKMLDFYHRKKHGLKNGVGIHTLKRTRIEEILKDKGLSIYKIERYDSSGPGFVSYRYITKKI
jgi:ubiquinone/menaquinone biosynthesis C-methylase UbiE